VAVRPRRLDGRVATGAVRPVPPPPVAVPPSPHPPRRPLPRPVPADRPAAVRLLHQERRRPPLPHLPRPTRPRLLRPRGLRVGLPEVPRRRRGRAVRDRTGAGLPGFSPRRLPRLPHAEDRLRPERPVYRSLDPRAGPKRAGRPPRGRSPCPRHARG